MATRARRAEVTVLRKGDELKVEVGSDPLLRFEKRFDGQQPIVAHVDVAAHGKKAHGHGPVAIGERPFEHRLVGQERFQLAPQRDALEQGAGAIDARNAVGQRRVHMEVHVHERRRDEAAGRVDGVAGLGVDARCDRLDSAGGYGDVGAAAIAQGAVPDQNVDLHGPSAISARPGDRAP